MPAMTDDLAGTTPAISSQVGDLRFEMPRNDMGSRERTAKRWRAPKRNTPFSH